MATIGTGVAGRALSNFEKITSSFSTLGAWLDLSGADRRGHVLPRGCRRPVRHGRVGPARGGHQGRGRRGAVRADRTARFPPTWSQLATNVVVSKYFYGEVNTPQRENSVRQLIHRVSRTIADWGIGRRLLRHRPRMASGSIAS